MNLQYSVAELRRHLGAIGIFRQGEAAPEVTKGALDAVEFWPLLEAASWRFHQRCGSLVPAWNYAFPYVRKIKVDSDNKR